MRYAMIALVLFVPCFVIGCGVLDWAVGIDDQGNDIEGPAPIEAAGNVANIWLPGAAALASGLVNIWQAVRGKKWKRAATSTFETIETVSDTQVGKDLKAKCKVAHQAAGVVKLVAPIIKSLGKKV